MSTAFPKIIVGTTLVMEIMLGSILTFSNLHSPYAFVGIDYWVFAAAGHVFSQGGPIYSQSAILHALYALNPVPRGIAHPGPTFTYLPGIAMLLVPFGKISYWAGFWLWSFLSLISVLWSVHCWWRWTRPHIPYWVWMSLIILSFPTLSGLHLGQFDAFLLGLLSLSYLAYRYQQWFWIGVLAILAAAIKPQLLLWLPFGYGLLVYRHPHYRWHFVGGIITAMIGLVIIPWLLRPFIWHGYFTAITSLGALQPNWSSLSALIRWLPGLQSASSGIADPWVDLIFVLGLTILGLWLRHLHSAAFTPAQFSATTNWMLYLAVPIFIWTAFTPYSHSNDLIILLPLLGWGLALKPTPTQRLWTWLPLILLLIGEGVETLVFQFIPTYNTVDSIALLLLLPVIIGWLRQPGFWFGQTPDPSPLPRPENAL